MGSQGALDRGGVDELAARVGIGARQLRRLFTLHIGASPLRIAQTRRLHFAKKLIDETSLSMTQVAFNAGYSSLRRFNTAFLETFQCAPTELRRSPKPQDLINANLECHGVISSRAEAIRQLAKAVHSGEICFNSTISSTELCQRLCDIKGIGQWTADYISMQALQEPDAFPSSDLVLRKNASLNGRLISAKQLSSLAEPWRRWQRRCFNGAEVSV